VITTPTAQIYGALERAYRFFNEELFGNDLPPVLFTLQHKGKGTLGYYASKRFEGRKSKRSTDEIALNPMHFKRPLIEILGTIVHQLVHLWQQHHDVPSRGGYHNRRWASKMMEVGLHPSETGRPGGKTTGQRMSHYLILGGPFDRASFDVVWAEAMAQKITSSKTASHEKPGRVRWSCPNCKLKAWAKPTALLVCGECKKPLVMR
jgi:hypothetical protein